MKISPKLLTPTKLKPRWSHLTEKQTPWPRLSCNHMVSASSLGIEISVHLSAVHLHPFLIGRSQTETQSQRSRHCLHTSLLSDRKTTLQCKLCLTKEWYEGRPVASPSCSPTWSLPERATHNHLLPGPPRLPRKGLTTKRLGRLITVTVFIVKLTESRIARETGLWMSCEHLLCNLLREDPL